MQHWVFDLDGTLVDSFPHYYSALERIFGERGKIFPNTKTARLEAISNMPSQIFRKYLGEAEVAAALLELGQRSEEDASRILPFEGTVDLLADLQEQGKKISVWTSRDLRSARLVLEHSGLGRYASMLVSGNCVQRHKPDPQGLEILANHHKQDLSDFVMIGDHEMDMQAGRKAGAHTIRASWHGHWDVPTCEIAHKQFYSLAELHEWSFKPNETLH